MSGSSTKTAQEINLEIASAGARTAIESVSRMNSLEPHRCRDIVDGLIKELSALPATKMSGKGNPNARSKTSHGKVS